MLKSRNIKIWTISIIVLFGAISLLPIENLYAATATTNQYENTKLSLTELETKYNERMNNLFNTKIKLMIDGKGTDKSPVGDDCAEDNYSTFCIAITAAKEFEQYQDALLARSTNVEIEENDDIFQVSAKQTAKYNEINTELRRAKKALDATLQAYNELKIAYPMHVQYQETIKNLTEYNKKMSKLRQEVEQLPGKFIDATTAACT